MNVLSNHLMTALSFLQPPLYAYAGAGFGVSGVSQVALGCRDTCSGSCSGSCSGDCDGSCAGDCWDSCSGSCDTNCD